MIARADQKHKRPGPKPKGVDAPPMGYSQAARDLGVSVPHLWAVLNGRRKSSKLVARYEAYNAHKAK